MTATHREFLAAIGGMTHEQFGARLPYDNYSHSVEDQQQADERIPYLLESCEGLDSGNEIRVLWLELRGPVDLTRWLQACPSCEDTGYVTTDHGYCSETISCPCRGQRPKIDWVILSGSPDSPTDLAWLRRVIADCKAAEVPCWVRIVGAQPFEDTSAMKYDWTNLVVRETPACFGEVG